MSNLKLAVRSFFKNPFVTIVAVISLALGIGANAAIFSLFNQILLQDLPVREPERLVNLSSPPPREGSVSCGDMGGCDYVFTYPMFRDLQRAQTVFTDIAAHVYFSANLSFRGQTRSGRGAIVSGSYFPVLGLQPALGRLLSPADDETVGEPHGVVISYAYWQSAFNQDPAVLNQTLILNGRPMTIIGVAASGFDGTSVGAMPQVFIPVTMADVAWPGTPPSWFQDRKAYHLYLFARLKPNVSIEQASAAVNGPYHSIINDVDAPLQKMSEQTLAKFKSKQLKLEPGRRGQSDLHEGAQVPLTLLLSVTAFVLIIACANIANLLLARAAARNSEMAIRLSIGGNRRQLIRQLLTESSLLAVAGGALGLLVAQWTLKTIEAIIPAEVTTLKFELDSTATIFAACLSLSTGLLFGLFPALHSTRPDLVSALKGQSGQPGGSRAAARFRVSLATAQIAMSMALLILAGLFLRSLANINRLELGFQAENVITFGVSPVLNGYPKDRSMALYERIEEELRTLPGVTHVTSSTVGVVAGDNWGGSVRVQGFQQSPDTDTHSLYTFIGPDYFKTFSIPLIAGREFTRADGARAEDVAIVNENFAEKFNLGRDAVGKRMNFGADSKLNIEIVGVAKNSKYSEVKDEPGAVFYLPYRQRPVFSATNFYLRTAVDPNQVLPAIRPLMSRIDANLPVERLQTMPEQVRANITVDRIISTLSTAFAGVATILAAIGLYGVLAYTVAQRTREIGVRMALGAAPVRIRKMILRQVAVMTAVGGAIGIAAAVALGKFAESLLFKLNAHDPIVLAASVVLLIIVSLAAGFVPALRASRVDPIRALRYE